MLVALRPNFDGEIKAIGENGSGLDSPPHGTGYQSVDPKWQQARREFGNFDDPDRSQWWIWRGVLAVGMVRVERLPVADHVNEQSGHPEGVQRLTTAHESLYLSTS